MRHLPVSYTNSYTVLHFNIPTSPLTTTYVWRRGSESNRRMRLLQSPALPLGYPAAVPKLSSPLAPRKFKFISDGFFPAHYQGTPLRPVGSPILDLNPPTGVTRESGSHGRVESPPRAGAPSQPRRFACTIRNLRARFRRKTEIPDIIDLKKESNETKSLATKLFVNSCTSSSRSGQAGLRRVDRRFGSPKDPKTAAACRGCPAPLGWLGSAPSIRLEILRASAVNDKVKSEDRAGPARNAMILFPRKRLFP